MHLFRFTTAGESHGPGLIALVEGAPSGLRIRGEEIDAELQRRQGGYGRGGRMRIESDRAQILSGVRHGEALGSPIALLIRNKDWENWTEAMRADPPDDPADAETHRRVFQPRPGHADLVGVLKYDRTDARDILERASARETAARVAAGAVAKALLREFGVQIGSHVISLGGVTAAVPEALPEDLNAASDVSPVRCLDETAEQAMIAAIDDAKRDGDTLGGVFEVVATGLPVGLGSHVSWHTKLDGRLAGAVMSIQALKGVEIGSGFTGANTRGSKVHDEILLDRQGVGGGGYARRTNRAGGLEGGITTGAPLIVRGAMKPISTLMQPLQTVDLNTGETVFAVRERSDVCALPAAAVVGEAMVALVLAEAMLESFGTGSLRDLIDRHDAYLRRVGSRHGGE